MDTITMAGLAVLACALWYAMGKAGLSKYRIGGLIIWAAVFAAGRLARHG